MKLKPSKCRSFSITSGKPSVVEFQIGDHKIPSIKDEDQKFLGKLLFFSGKSEETFNHIKDIFKEALENIDNSSVRNEYKLWIYSNYLLPSKRFLLTVHNMTETHLKKLDVFTDKSVKKWAGVPLCATNAIIHLREGLYIKSISELYMETHCVSHARTRLQGDESVNFVVNSSLVRESGFTRKKSTTTEAEVEYSKAVNMNTVQGEIPNFSEHPNGQWEKQLFEKEIKEQIKTSLLVKNQEKWISHVKSLVQQGHFLSLASAEHQDVIWKSYMYNLKQGTLKFLLNASLDTLPTAANLLKWNKTSSDQCKLCKARETTLHILNNCPISLNNGKYLWRHNNVVNYVVKLIDTTKFSVFSDLPGHTVGGGSIPPELCITVQKPDIVIQDKKTKSLHIFELSVPIETNGNIDKRHREKSDRYAHFVTDMSGGYTCKVTCFELGSRGYISTGNHSAFVTPGIKLTKFKQNNSALSVYGSYHLFVEPTFLLPWFEDRLLT